MTVRPDITPHLPLIRGKCAEVQRHYRGYVEVDDLVQEVALWWYGEVDPAFLELYVSDAVKSRLRRCVWRVAAKAAEQLRRTHTHDEVFVQSRYHAREILQLLPVAIDPDGLPDGGGIKDGPKAKGNVAEGGNVLASLIDTRRAWDALPEHDRDYIHSLDHYRWEFDTLAGVLGVEGDSVRRRVHRICERMARWLNNESTEDAA